MKTGLLIAIVFFAVGGAAGVAMLWSSFASLKRAVDAEHWPTTTAEVQHSALRKSEDSEGTATYAVEVNYTYQVNGVPYSGNTIGYGYAGGSGYEQHRKLFEKIRSVQSVLVRYEPTDPQNSSITYGPSRSHLIRISFAITWCLLLVGLITVLLAFLSSDDRMLSRISIVNPVGSSVH